MSRVWSVLGTVFQMTLHVQLRAWSADVCHMGQRRSQSRRQGVSSSAKFARCLSRARAATLTTVCCARRAPARACC